MNSLLNIDDFLLKMMDFVFKRMDFVSKRMDFVSKMMNLYQILPLINAKLSEQLPMVAPQFCGVKCGKETSTCEKCDDLLCEMR